MGGETARRLHVKACQRSISTRVDSEKQKPIGLKNAFIIVSSYVLFRLHDFLIYLMINSKMRLRSPEKIRISPLRPIPSRDGPDIRQDISMGTEET